MGTLRSSAVPTKFRRPEEHKGVSTFKPETHNRVLFSPKDHGNLVIHFKKGNNMMAYTFKKNLSGCNMENGLEGTLEIRRSIQSWGTHEEDGSGQDWTYTHGKREKPEGSRAI